MDPQKKTAFLLIVIEAPETIQTNKYVYHFVRKQQKLLFLNRNRITWCDQRSFVEVLNLNKNGFSKINTIVTTILVTFVDNWKIGVQLFHLQGYL